MDTIWQDIRYGLRTLIKIPGFTAVAVLTLALGIGANTAIFTAIHSVLLSSLPVKNPQELVFLTDPDSHGMGVGSNTGDRALLTYHEFQQLRIRNQVFSDLLAAHSSVIRRDVTVEGSEPAPAQILMVSGDYFSVLGITPLLGRAFTGKVDKVRDANPVAVVSYSFWKGRLGGDPSVIGRRIQILKTSFDIIGVTPPSFFGETVGAAPDIWVPLTMQSEIIPGRDFLTVEKNPLEKTEWLTVIGRLKPSVSVAQAKASINVTFQQILQSQMGSQMAEKDRHDFLDQRLAVVAGSHGASTVREKFGQPLLILMAVVGLVLLLVLTGAAIGLPAVMGAGKAISSLLFGMTAADPLALTLATVLMFAVAALAGYIPARRASRTDLLVALQYE